MGEQLRNFRLAGLEDWRIKAFNFGGPLGSVFSRTFELMHTVIRDGAANEQSVGYAMASLERERELALSRDEYGDDAINSLIYAVADNLKFMMDSILEERRPRVEERPQASTSSSDDVLPLLHVPKQEPLFDVGQGNSRSSAQVNAQAQGQPQTVQRKTGHQTAPLKRAHAGEASAISTPPAKRIFDAASIPMVTPAAAVPAAPTPAARPLSATPATPKIPVPAVVDGTKPAVVLHICDKCDKTFESNKGLQRHAFTHEALRCEVCRKFVNPNKMTAHLAQFHGRKKVWNRYSDDEEGVCERRHRTPSPTVSEMSTASTIAYKTPEEVTNPVDPATIDAITTPTAVTIHATITSQDASAKTTPGTATISTAATTLAATPTANTPEDTPTPATTVIHEVVRTPPELISLETGTTSTAPAGATSPSSETTSSAATKTPGVVVGAPPLTFLATTPTSAEATSPVAPTTPAASPTDGAPFPCKQCEKVFDTRAGLRRHEHVHDVSECPACGREITKTRMSAHLKTHDAKGPTRDRLSCPIPACEAYRTSPSMMKGHLRMAHGIKPYACAHCPETFLLHSELRKHKVQCKETLREHNSAEE